MSLTSTHSQFTITIHFSHHQIHHCLIRIQPFTFSKWLLLSGPLHWILDYIYHQWMLLLTVGDMFHEKTSTFLNEEGNFHDIQTFSRDLFINDEEIYLLQDLLRHQQVQMVNTGVLSVVRGWSRRFQGGIQEGQSFTSHVQNATHRTYRNSI